MKTMKLLQKKHWDALYKMAEKKWHWIIPVKVDYKNGRIIIESKKVN